MEGQKEIHQLLEFNNHKINMYGYIDNPAFNPNEICEILQIKKNQDRIISIRKEYEFGCPLKGRPKVRGKDIILITERGFHEIVMTSRSPYAS